MDSCSRASRYRRGVSGFVAICGLLFSSYRLAVGADEEQTLTVWSRVTAMEKVSRSYVVVADTNKVVAVAPLAYVESPQSKEATVLGRLRVDSQASNLRMLFAIMNTEGAARSVLRDVRPEDLPMVTRLTTSQLRDRFVERRGVLRQMQTSLSALENRLATLQEDADAIANVNKLVNAEDELSELKVSLERVQLAHTSIQNQVALLRSRPPPLSARRRQADLAKQLAEMSTALTKTEAGAFQRMRAASIDLQSKLKDIEETREDHVGLLEEELAQAKRESGKRTPGQP
jgi:hypothetical protein